jgi:hypothetical protein
MSTRKRQANLANSRASTGPRTSLGRSRSARNALRHGLAVPISQDRALSADVEALVRELVGKTASHKAKEMARPVAEAQINLNRVRRTRSGFVVKALGDPNYESQRASEAMVKLLIAGRVTLDELIKPVDRTLEPERPQKYLAILCDSTKHLMAFDRYERRALSRRKFAIRAFDAAGFTWAQNSNCIGNPQPKDAPTADVPQPSNTIGIRSQ